MRRPLTALLLSALALPALAADRQTADHEPAETLRHAVKGRFLIGTAVMSRQLDNSGLADLVARQFDCLTGENEFKPQSLQPQAGQVPLRRGGQNRRFRPAPRHEGGRAQPLLAQPDARLDVPGRGRQAAVARRRPAEPQGPHRRRRWGTSRER